MKSTILTTALAGFGLAILPLHAEEPAAKPAAKPTATSTEKTAAEAKTIPTYLVVFSGGG